jgi:caffeoyl-CoA O-methyltransferase
LIIADNVLWSGDVLRQPKEHDEQTRALVNYAERVNRDPRVEPVLVPLRDGLMLSRVK